MATTFRNKKNHPLGVGTLNTAIDDNDLSIVLDAGQGASFPSATFTISIDEEIILIDSRSTDTLTVNASGRGYDSSTASAHAAGVAITNNQIVKDFTDLETAVNTIESKIDGTNPLVLDDVYLKFGTDSDIRVGYDETTDDRLEFTDGTNLLSWITDTGSWGRVGSSGILEARRSVTTISVSSITRSSQTATVTTASAHGLSTGDFCNITGAVETPYNGAFRITRTGATTFTFTVDGSPTTPATGTILFKAPVQLFFNDDANSAPLNMVCNVDISYLNPGTTTVAHIITNRESGHLIFDIYGNDARDSISFRTNSSTGTLDAIDTILMTLNCNNRVGIKNANPLVELDVTGAGNFTGAMTVGGTFTANGNSQFGDASTDVVTFTARMLPRSVTDAGPMTATPGTQREIVFNTSDNKWYGCTVTHGTAATWSAFN